MTRRENKKEVWNEWPWSKYKLPYKPTSNILGPHFFADQLAFWVVVPFKLAIYPPVDDSSETGLKVVEDNPESTKNVQLNIICTFFFFFGWCPLEVIDTLKHDPNENALGEKREREKRAHPITAACDAALMTVELFVSEKGGEKRKKDAIVLMCQMQVELFNLQPHQLQ